MSSALRLTTPTSRTMTGKYRFDICFHPVCSARGCVCCVCASRLRAFVCPYPSHLSCRYSLTQPKSRGDSLLLKAVKLLRVRRVWLPRQRHVRARERVEPAECELRERVSSTVKRAVKELVLPICLDWRGNQLAQSGEPTAAAHLLLFACAQPLLCAPCRQHQCLVRICCAAGRPSRLRHIRSMRYPARGQPQSACAKSLYFSPIRPLA